MTAPDVAGPDAGAVVIRPIADDDGDRPAEQACVRGITTFLAETLAVNGPMRHVFRNAGYPMTSRIVDGSDEARMDIRSAAAEVVDG